MPKRKTQGAEGGSKRRAPEKICKAIVETSTPKGRGKTQKGSKERESGE
uniref:Uncharacterized protein n=1 Tax=Anguilla anguilla TaxID=7936 RepID=A0A0E9RUS4_ANGAN